MKKHRQTKLDIQVWADWRELKSPKRLGTLSSLLGGGEEIFSFEYAQEWLELKFAYQLDPGLQMFAGPQYGGTDRENFGIFLDSAPDRWGRTLQKRREAIRARKNKEKEKRLLESDFLLGVYDRHRPGALRFRINESGPFLNDDANFSAPPMTSLRELEAAAWSVENENKLALKDEEKWVNMLIAPGGSLGGARPKASVMDEKKQLWIAKFPSRQDNFDSGLWEFVVHQLASTCGIKVPPAQVRKFSSAQHTFLLQRFDRAKDERIHYASAMTILNKGDGANAADGSSYLEIAEFIMRQGAQSENDLKELWTRIVFNMCVSNTDDHLRNHGFLLTPNGWVLSPAFDVNPNPDGEGLRLNISETDNSQDLALALEVSPIFRIKKAVAEKISFNVIKRVREWRRLASRLKMPKIQQNAMARAFRMVE